MSDTNHAAVSLWMTAYRNAWESNEPDDIRALFTEDAEYFTEPFAEPWRGYEGIVSGWLEARDEPGETTFEWEPVAIEKDVAVVRAVTAYGDRATYYNVWVIRFAPNGRASAFTEWWMTEKAAS